jgi:pentatricopeptide repeat protein
MDLTQPNSPLHPCDRACAKGGNTKRALSLLQVVKDKGLPLDTYCYTAVIDACAKAKMWRKALGLLDEMQEKGIEPSEVTYSVTISACGNGGQWQRALDLLDLMKTKGMSVNAITYNAALTALSKAARQHARHISKVATDDVSVRMGFRKSQATKDVQYDDTDIDTSIPVGGLSPKALEILDDMRSNGIEPDGFCYSSAISCCGAEGRWKEALDLIDTMKRGGPRTRPNRIAYTAAIGACGKAGKAKQALELFQAMKNEGLSADRVAYNSLFTALRVAGDAEKTYELWGEMCGTRVTVSKAVIATAKDFASPDIITLTDCIATLSRAGKLEELDQVFQEGVSRGIVLRSNGLDLQWETDLSGMSLPVARAAIRYLLNRCLQKEMDHTQLRDMSFITGIGVVQQRRREDGGASEGRPPKEAKDPTTSLRDHVQAVLRQDFQPPLESVVPLRAQGTVEIPKEKLLQWVRSQQG